LPAAVDAPVPALRRAVEGHPLLVFRRGLEIVERGRRGDRVLERRVRRDVVDTPAVDPDVAAVPERADVVCARLDVACHGRPRKPSPCPGLARAPTPPWACCLREPIVLPPSAGRRQRPLVRNASGAPGPRSGTVWDRVPRRGLYPSRIAPPLKRPVPCNNARRSEGRRTWLGRMRG